MILSSADNRPPMLDKDLYDSWKSRMELYMQNREHGRMTLESVENGPLIWPTVEENGVTRTKKYVELSIAEKIQADCDMKATNIILQGEIECKLYDAFDKFTHIKGETLYKYYLRFTQLIHDMNIYSLPPEWSKFVTDVKLVKDLHSTNFDQLHAYLEQHKLHTNESRLSRVNAIKIPLAFMAKVVDWNTTSTTTLISLQYNNSSDSTTVFTISVDNPIVCLNKAMAFLTAVASSRGNNASGQARVVKCYNCQDLGVPDGQAVQTIIPNNTTFQTEDLDTYGYDCDDISNAMQDFKQPPAVDFTDNEIHSDSNIIPYS
ncbi:hypothetical protein Tco_1097320 [Tanacetum coccineum]